MSGHLVLNCIVRNVQCTNASKYGMWLRDTITSIFFGCDFSYNRGQGVQQEFVGDGAVALHFYCCTFSHNGSRGFLSPNCVALSFTNCSFSGNNLLGGAGSGAAEGSNFQMTNGNAITFNTCEFGQPGSNVENLVFLSGMSGPCAIYACNFDGGYIGGGPGQGAYAQRGLRTSASPGGQNVILLGCHWSELAAVSTPAGAVADIDGLGAVVGAHAFDSSAHSILLESADGVQLKGGAFARQYSALPNPSSVQVGTIAYLSVAGQGRIAVRVPNGWHTLQPF